MADGHYHPLGLPALREAIAASYTAAGLETDARQVLVTTGRSRPSTCARWPTCSEAIRCSSRTTYFGALDVPPGRRPVGLGPRRSAWRRSDAACTRTVASAPRLIYLSPTFQNPTGGVMPPAARERVAALARETGVPVVEDATLADLAFDGAAPKPLAAYASEAPIITIGSLSKVAWPGLRIGWVRGPISLIPTLARVKSVMDLGSPSLTQAAVRLLAHVERIHAAPRTAPPETRHARSGCCAGHFRMAVHRTGRRPVPVGGAAVG